ncbi:DUF1810 domain-containing protein [Crenobacter caeni]|uniref:DUF1810 domain-containing protein n=1 Tax=Crenobacter caeni TaxID=2705474 RepID=A0A6B2KUI3_9NEIS|nr:DUF1810 domain-containing protein [Crenobacter caeni]NDV13906.1 DUF1810 domain-containing protein [Crenobacter caeni]
MDEAGLARFVRAQDAVYPAVLAELAAARKRSHWMWFVFPQLDGLGHSAMAERYALADLAQARAYWAHPTLGPRLAECLRALLAHRSQAIRDILGRPDDLKLCSCVTLFGRAVPEEPLFAATLAAFYGGKEDPLPLRLLGL